METRNSRSPRTRGLVRCLRPLFRVSFFGIFVAVLCAGCGAPGEPTAPAPIIPAAISDLAAAQSGDGVLLTFTLPAKTIAGERLADAPAIEILRGAAKPNGSPDAKSFRVVYTIPAALVNNYQADDHAQFVDPVPPAEARAAAGGVLLYRVRTRASRKRTSDDSNTVIVRMVPVAERITSLQTKLTKDAVELTWSAPTRTSSGEPLASVSEYHVYRGELDPASTDTAAGANPPKDLSEAKWKSPPAFLGSSTSTSYRDTAFDFGKTYAYTVRAVTQADGHPLESSDSAPAIVTPRDIFPPATPADVRASVIVGNPTNQLANPAEVDLSWSINAEPDLAGYRVYRSERQDTRGELVTPDLLLSPAYRDTSVQPGHRYWYRVTSLDRSGNESAPSEPVAADLTQPSA